MSSIRASVLLSLFLVVSCDVQKTDEGVAASSAHHAFVQFASIPDDEAIARLSDAGVSLTGHATGGTYVASIPGSGRAALESEGGRYLGSLPATAKAASPLLAGSAGAWARAGGKVQLSAWFHSDVALATAVETAASAGAEVTDDHEFAGFRMLRLSVDPGRIGTLAATDSIRWLREIGPPLIALNQNAAVLSNVDDLWAAPYGSGSGLSGLGIKVGIWDGGPVYPHSEFGARLSYGPDLAGNTNYYWHATHCAGTMGAKGNTAAAHGMAGSVDIVSYDWVNTAPEYVSAAALGVIAGNNSFGSRLGWWSPDGSNPPWTDDVDSVYFGAYSSTCVLWDNAARQADQAGNLHLICFAAGNDRDDGPSIAVHDGWHQPADTSIPNPYYDTILDSATAKNIMTVGAVDAAGVSTFESSIGPVNDGRIKPDIVAKGDNTFSTTTGNGYVTAHGTSMACPVVVGSAALLVQEFELRFGRRPSTSELKAIMLHTATDRGRLGPDYVYGWGLLNARAAADHIRLDGGAQTRILRGSVANANHDAFHFQAGPGAPIRITMTWIDPPGDTDDPTPLVNNLDIKLRSPSGTFHYPYRLDPANPLTPAGDLVPGPNLVDTVEQIYVASPEAGVWQLDIAGTLVPVGPVQTYGLVSSHGLTPGWFVPIDIRVGSDASDNSVITWNPVTDPYVAGFRVLRFHAGAWTVIADEDALDASTVEYVDTTAPSSGLVMWDVRAVIDLGSGNEFFSANPTAQRTDPPTILTPAEGPVSTGGVDIAVAGIAEPGSLVELFEGGSLLGQATAAANGTWTISAFFDNGTHTLTASAQLGNEAESIPSFERTFLATD